MDTSSLTSIIPPFVAELFLPDFSFLHPYFLVTMVDRMKLIPTSINAFGMSQKPVAEDGMPAPHLHNPVLAARKIPRPITDPIINFSVLEYLLQQGLLDASLEAHCDHSQELSVLFYSSLFLTEYQRHLLG